MKNYVNPDGNRVIQINKDFHLFIRKEPNRKFILWNAPGMKKFAGLKHNIRFKAENNKNWCNHWMIELPFFHWIGDNAKWEIGTQRIQLCCTKWRAN